MQSISYNYNNLINNDCSLNCNFDGKYLKIQISPLRSWAQYGLFSTSPRKNVIRLIFVAMFVVVIARLFMLQIVSSKYKILADDQGKFRKIVYPDRGIVYDRNGKVILDNTTISFYDLDGNARKSKVH